MSKKLHLKDLRRDEDVVAVNKAAESTFEFSQQHRRGLLYAGLAILAIAIVGVLIAWRMDSSRRASLAAYSEASRAWSEAAGETVVDEGQEKPTWDEVAARFQAVVAEHGGSNAAVLASLHHGLALQRAGKASEAAAALDGFVDSESSHWAVPDALAALAVAREDAGDVAGAEAALVQLRDGKWRSWPDGAAQFLLAQLHERQGKTAEARTLYETLSANEKLEGTTWASQARQRLDEMGAEPASS